LYLIGSLEFWEEGIWMKWYMPQWIEDKYYIRAMASCRSGITKRKTRMKIRGEKREEIEDTEPSGFYQHYEDQYQQKQRQEIDEEWKKKLFLPVPTKSPSSSATAPPTPLNLSEMIVFYGLLMPIIIVLNLLWILPCWLIVGFLLYSSKMMCIGPIYNLWHLIYTGSHRHATPKLIETGWFKKEIYSGIVLESIPQLLLQTINSVKLGKLGPFTLFSISMSTFTIFYGVYRFGFTTLIIKKKITKEKTGLEQFIMVSDLSEPLLNGVNDGETAEKEDVSDTMTVASPKSAVGLKQVLQDFTSLWQSEDAMEQVIHTKKWLDRTSHVSSTTNWSIYQQQQRNNMDDENQYQPPSQFEIEKNQIEIFWMYENRLQEAKQKRKQLLSLIAELEEKLRSSKN
jgi:hypothetical protein